jgi:phosphatidate phosphatase
MDKQEKKIVVKIVLDVALLACGECKWISHLQNVANRISFSAALPILIFYLFGTGYQRGFFCDDESLMHPVHSDTVTHEMLYIGGFGIPILTILITEMVRWKLQLDGDRQLQLFGYEIPFWAQNLYRYIGFFLFGATCCQLVTDIAKYSIGRFRPHFITLCQPVMNGGTNCSDAVNLHRYIEDFTCGNINATPRQLKEMRLSFPSGHSSFSMYTMLFTALYLHCRFSCKQSKLAKHFLQFLLISLAWYTALTRISNYKHHCELIQLLMSSGVL